MLRDTTQAIRSKPMMRSEGENRGPGSSSPIAAGFTLVELLVVIAIIGLLAALLFPVLSTAKARGQSTSCKNHLRQIGIAFGMYVSDFKNYPPAHSWQTRQVWMDRLYPYYPLQWTNPAWQCPTYMGNHGLAVYWVTNTTTPWAGARVWTGYSYNCNGIIGNGWAAMPSTILTLRGKFGLGGRSQYLSQDPELAAPDSQVAAPSQMYAVADARPFQRGPGPGWFPIEPPNATLGMGSMASWVDPWYWDASLRSLKETNPPHKKEYNIQFCDGHVALVKRNDYLFPPRTAQNWNRDNLPHPEAWAPQTEWAVQQ